MNSGFHVGAFRIPANLWIPDSLGLNTDSRLLYMNYGGFAPLQVRPLRVRTRHDQFAPTNNFAPKYFNSFPYGKTYLFSGEIISYDFYMMAPKGAVLFWLLLKEQFH